MFKLLAIRPLDGCAAYVKKCLRTRMMYYFCDDYIIMEGQGIIRRASRNLSTLKEDFFSIEPTVNVSAIVGMNGDGKSTLVELMIRLINNCAYTYQLTTSHDKIRRIENVKAELFYMIDNKIYRMGETDGDHETWIWEIADISDKSMSEWHLNNPILVSRGNETSCFFFNYISNYSHYAYNIYDFHQEWEERGWEEDDDEKCWLHYIFHKNDGYITPITLHPYRDKGNIDINNENTLSKQRLLYLFLNAENPQFNPMSFRRINGKDAAKLILSAQPSKLQQTAIIEQFKYLRSEMIFNTVLNQLNTVMRSDADRTIDIEYERLIDTVLPYYFEEPLDEVLEQDGFGGFVKETIKWLIKKNVLPKSSEIHSVLRQLKKLSETLQDFRLKEIYKSYHYKYGYIGQLNAGQIGRLDTIYRILKFYRCDPTIVTKAFAELSLEEVCQHYIVYKTWSILTTYPQYVKILEVGKSTSKVQEYGCELEKCMQMIVKDTTSHITRKLRQVINFMNEGLHQGGLYERLGDRLEDGRIMVDIDKLRGHYDGFQIKSDHLPPAIYQWDLIFKQMGEDDANIEFDSFSSGEKQMLNSIGAIIYHLQNLEDSSTIHYSNVNIILEEIELYFHPECQREFIKRLLELIKGQKLEHVKNINIVFVTHSPFILSDIPKCNVLFLKNGIAQDSMQENTFGANIHSILKNGFFLPNLPMGEFAYTKINNLFKLLNTGDFNPNTDMEDIYQQILLVGEPYLRNQLLGLYHAYKGN